jgi:hypothetical protein
LEAIVDRHVENPRLNGISSQPKDAEMAGKDGKTSPTDHKTGSGSLMFSPVMKEKSILASCPEILAFKMSVFKIKVCSYGEVTHPTSVV